MIFHHSATVALTGHHEAYYNDYRGRPSEFRRGRKARLPLPGAALPWQKNPRGSPSLDLAAECFVVFLQNHDQSPTRAPAPVPRARQPGRLRAMTAYSLLMPGIPIAVSGQEFGASTPFFYFADHEGELARAVRRRSTSSPVPQPREQRDAGGADRPRRYRHLPSSVLDHGERQP